MKGVLLEKVYSVGSDTPTILLRSRSGSLTRLLELTLLVYHVCLNDIEPRLLMVKHGSFLGNGTVDSWNSLLGFEIEKLIGHV